MIFTSGKFGYDIIYNIYILQSNVNLVIRIQNPELPNCSLSKERYISYAVGLNDCVSLVQMKLEKKRSRSMDKILNKLKVSQRKAEEMRSSISITQEEQVPQTLHKFRFFQKHVQKSSFRTCFTGHGT